MIYRMCIMMSAIIIGDQLTKAVVQQKFYLGETIPVIPNLFHFTYVRNPGAAFGMFGYATDWIRIPLFFGVPVIACFWLLYLIWSTRNTKKLQCLAYSLIFAGAVGNLIDRFSMNYVVDFLDFFWGAHHFPAFNVADSSITIAAFILIYETIITSRKESNSATSTV